MSIEKRTNGRWRARVTHRGKVVGDKTFDRKWGAELWESEQRRAIAMGTFVPPTMTSKPLREVVAVFLQDRKKIVSPHAWRTDRDNLAHLLFAKGSRRKTPSAKQRCRLQPRSRTPESKRSLQTS